MSALFLSHSSRDRVVVAEITARLRSDGFDAIFVDSDPSSGIPVGSAWEQELYRQLHIADGILFVASASSVSSRWCFAELAIARALGRPVFPLRVDHSDAGTVLRDVQWIDYQEADGWERLLAGLERAGLTARDSFSWQPGRSPFPGLAAFRAEDAAVFFGRDNEVTELQHRLEFTSGRQVGQFVVVVGPSGSGKSSLVGAGLMPRLARGRDRWIVIPGFVPRQQPTRELALSLGRAFRGVGAAAAFSDPDDSAAADTSWLVDQVRRLREAGDGPRNRPVVLFMDQCEQLLTDAPPETARKFLGMLRGAVDADPLLRIVATLRTDFLAPVLEQSGGGRLFDDTYVVGPMSRDRLSEVIVEPARRAGLHIEPRLVQRMMNDTVGDDSLPLLAFTLQRLHDRTKPDRTIDVDDYEAVGGVVGSLQSQADNVLRRLGAEFSADQVLTTLLSLASVYPTGEVVGRPMVMDAATADQTTILNAFVEARLLASSDSGANRVFTVAHEALLRQWPPMRSMINTSRRSMLIRTEVEQTTRSWIASGRDEAFLPRGARLAAAVEELGEPSHSPFSSSEVTFLESSRTFAGRTLERARRTNRRLRRLSVGLIAFVVIAAIVSLVALDATRRAEEQRVQAENARQRAEDEKRSGTARGFVAEADLLRERQPQLALMLGAAALGLSSSPRAEASLVKTLTETRYTGTVPRLPATALALNPRQPVMAVGAFKRVEIWSTMDPARPRRLSTLSSDPSKLTPGAGYHVHKAAFAPNGLLLASAGVDHKVYVWDVSNPPRSRRVATLSGHADDVTSISFDPDSRRMATGDAQGAVLLWDVTKLDDANPRPVGRAGKDAVLAFSADGRTLAAGGADRKIRLWDVARGKTPRLTSTLGGHAGGITALAFDPSRSRLISGDSEGMAITWSLRGAAHRVGTPLTGQADLRSKGRIVAAVTNGEGHALVARADSEAVSVVDVTAPDRPRLIATLGGGASLVALGADGTAATQSIDTTLWNLRDRYRPVQRGVLAGEGSLSAELSPDGNILATGTKDQVSLWDVEHPSTPVKRGMLPVLANRWVKGFAFTAEGDQLVTLAKNTAAAIWNVSNPTAPEPLGAIPGTAARSLAMSSDGVLAIRHQKSVSLWDLTDIDDPKEVSTFDAPDVMVSTMAFSPDGQLLVIGGHSEGDLWDVSDADNPQHLEGLHASHGFVSLLAFSPDSNNLLLGGYGQRIYVWNVSDPENPELPYTLSGHEADPDTYLETAAFHPDGRLLVTGDERGRLLMWDLTDARHPDQTLVLRESGGSVGAVAFSSDGETLYTTNSGEATRIWSVAALVGALEDPAAHACALAGRELSRSEWQQYGPETPYEPTCPP